MRVWCAQAMVASIALVADLGKGLTEILILNGFFVMLFVGSALLPSFGRIVYPCQLLCVGR